MTHTDIVRAWKDAEYRNGLSDEARRRIPAHPAGVIELTDADMGAVIGGESAVKDTYYINCTLEIHCRTIFHDLCLVTPGTGRLGPQPLVPPPVIKG